MTSHAFRISAQHLYGANFHDENEAEKSYVEQNPAGSVQVSPGFTGGRTKRERRVGSGSLRKGAIRSIKAVEALDDTAKTAR
jgi:hypothetical protein